MGEEGQCPRRLHALPQRERQGASCRGRGEHRAERRDGLCRSSPPCAGTARNLHQRDVSGLAQGDLRCQGHQAQAGDQPRQGRLGVSRQGDEDEAERLHRRGSQGDLDGGSGSERPDAEVGPMDRRLYRLPGRRDWTASAEGLHGGRWRPVLSSDPGGGFGEDRNL